MLKLSLMLEQTYLEVAKFSLAECCKTNHLIVHVSREVHLERFNLTYILLRILHLIMFILILLSIIFDRKLNDIKSATD